MNNLQERVFTETKNLIKKFNLMRFALYFFVSTTVVIIILLILSMLDWYNTIFVIVLAILYSFVRDFSIARYSLKTLDRFYEYLKDKEPNIDLYIPVLEKNYQGYFLKKTALYFKGDEMYLEAFKQSSSKKEKQDSITVNYGRDFTISLNHLDKDGKVYLFESFLMDTDYRFSIVNIPEVINRINQRVKGE
ncbi:MAG: hypothetical protein RQ856_04180 [Candidatus Izemoplasmatales bacterium]|nr:hypothetical protein [Candidatus Izemoplasmatales bacterium]